MLPRPGRCRDRSSLFLAGVRAPTLKRFPNGLFGDPVGIRLLVSHSHLHQARGRPCEREAGLKPPEFPERDAVIAMFAGLTNKRERLLLAPPIALNKSSPPCKDQACRNQNSGVAAF
jgi:hypothetical protein